MNKHDFMEKIRQIGLNLASQIYNLQKAGR